MPALTGGKLVNLLRLADTQGRFKMLAVDQRASLQASLASATGREPEDVTYDEMAKTKQLITEVLSPFSTATLIDPVYGFPRTVKIIPRGVGILLASDETGHEPAGIGGRERKGRLIDGWSVAKAKRAGANAVKLLIHYNPEASIEVRDHQQELVRTVGEDCVREDVPFLLEVVTYPLDEATADTPAFAKKRPHHTIEAAHEFSKEEYSVDILKLEFPSDLKYTLQFHDMGFDKEVRPPVYDLDDVRVFCRQLDAVVKRPWVILSGGVDIKEFLVNLELAVEAGASGFLCGRAIWKGVISSYPHEDRMRGFLVSEGVDNFARANAITERARAWFAHPSVGGWDEVQLRDGHEEWYRHYGEVRR